VHETASEPQSAPFRSPQSLRALLAVASSWHGPEGHYHLPSTGVPPGPHHDHLSSAARALEWLGPRRELTVPRTRPSPTDLAMLRGIRSAVQSLARGDRRGYRALVARLLRRGRYELTPEAHLEPAASGWPAITTGLLVPLVYLDAHRARLKRCRNGRCGFVFLDLSDNQTRQWCSDICANRMKVRRYRARHRGQAVTRTKPRSLRRRAM
jgi:CGNR zinc finger protein